MGELRVLEHGLETSGSRDFGGEESGLSGNLFNSTIYARNVFSEGTKGDK